MTERGQLDLGLCDGFRLFRKLVDQFPKRDHSLRLLPLFLVAHAQPILRQRGVGPIRLSTGGDLLVDLDGCVEVTDRFFDIDTLLQEC